MGLPKRGPKTAFKKRGYRRGPGDNPGYNIGISFLCHLSVIQSVSFPYESHSLVVRGRHLFFRCSYDGFSLRNIGCDYWLWKKGSILAECLNAHFESNEAGIATGKTMYNQQFATFRCALSRSAGQVYYGHKHPYFYTDGRLRLMLYTTYPAT
jgi:hypothetical protein